MSLVRDAFISWQAEVVFVTSNQRGNQEIMEGCMEARIPVFVGSSIPEWYKSLTRTGSGNIVGLLKWCLWVIIPY